MKVKIAFTLIFISILIFFAYLVTSLLNERISNVLILILLLLSLIIIILFKVINTRKHIYNDVNNNFKHDLALIIDVENLQLKTQMISLSEDYDEEDIELKRLDTVFRKKNNIDSSLINRTYIFYKKNDMIYISSPLNIDLKTLEIKLYMRKKVELLIDSKSKKYMFNLYFLNE